MWPGPRPTSIPSGILQSCSRVATIDMGLKLGGMPPFWGGQLDPHTAQCRLGRGLATYEVASCSIEPFGHHPYGPETGGCVPLGEVNLGPHLTQCGHGRAYLHAKFHLDPSNTPTLQTGQTGQEKADRQTDRKRSDSIGRTVLQRDAQKKSCKTATKSGIDKRTLLTHV